MTRSKRPSTPKQQATMAGLSQVAAAWLLGISPRKLRDHEDVPRNEDATYNARDLVAWWFGSPARIPDGDEDDKQRLVRAQADLAELKRDQRAGELLDRAAVREGMVVVARALRTAGEQLQRQYGADALDILNDGLAAADKALAEAMQRAAGGEQPRD